MHERTVVSISDASTVSTFRGAQVAMALRTRIIATSRSFTIDHNSLARCEVLATCGGPSACQSPET